MKLLKCILCNGELDIIDQSHVLKKIKCKKCGFSNAETINSKAPEILIIRKKPIDI